MIQSPSEHIGLNINDLTTTPHIEYKLMDEFLSLKSPYLSPAITDYLQGDKAIQDFVNRITLYKDRDFMYKESQNDPLVGVSFDKDNQDSVISLEIVNYERPRNSDLKESFIAMELITKPHNLLKKVYTDELVNQIFLILKPAAKGSLFHFRKIFMTALIYHPRLLFSFKSWIFLMVKQIINQPVQDAIVCCFTAIYTKKYLDSEDSLYAMIRDSGFLDCMFTKMVSSDIQIVRAFCSTILRILNILDLHDCNTLLCNYNAEKESDSNSNLPKMFENIVKMLDSSDSEIRNEIIDFVANMKFTGYCEPIKLQFMKALESQSHIVASVDLLKQLDLSYVVKMLEIYDMMKCQDIQWDYLFDLFNTKQNCSIYQSKLFKLIIKKQNSIREKYPKLDDLLAECVFKGLIVEVIEKQSVREEYELVNKTGQKERELVVDEV